ncbi:MAG: aldo/keto reductase, partial [Armatimonadetes bacterium]|nr:aldo/keto reductase [Armatimonadota bacterium]
LGQALRDLGLHDLALSEARVTTKGGHPDAGDLYPRPERYLAPELLMTDLLESHDRLRHRVDTFLLHRDDPREPVADIADALGRLRDHGMTRALGVSNWPRARVAELRQLLVGELVWQNQGSLAVSTQREGPDPTTRAFTVDDFAWAADHGVICTCYSATANGYFARDGQVPSFDSATNRARLAVAAELARAKGASANQIALAWLLAQPGDVRPILGTTNVAHLEDAMGAQAIELTADERDALTVFAP